MYGTFDEANCGYYAMFPASCPYVTAVGGTSGGTDGDLSQQVACSSSTGQNITTGGGFSGYFLMPSFQVEAVDLYLSQVTPEQSTTSPYSTQFRAYPDVSLIAADYRELSSSIAFFIYLLEFRLLLVILVGGKYFLISGTGASTAVIAGMVSIINSIRLASGNPPLGWITPGIYA